MRIIRRRIIRKSKKVFIVHPNTIRALLKKNDFSIGSWHANGRISGMSDFNGGSLEVKENEINFDVENKKIGEKLWKRIVTLTVNVKIAIWKDIDVEKMIKIIKSAGFKIEKEDNDFIVSK